MTMELFTLVQCAKGKADRAVEARDLYQSSYFTVNRRWAEQSDRWAVLSAHHGLVDPDTVLDPYDRTLKNMDRTERLEWGEGVVNELRERDVAGYDGVVILGGKDYTNPLLHFSEDIPTRVFSPYQSVGGGMGKHMAWANANPPADITDPADLTPE